MFANELNDARNATSRCVECGKCEKVQNEGCGCTPGSWGSFARTLIEQASCGSISESTQRLLFTCSLCGACTHECPVGIDGPSVVRDGRDAFLRLRPAAQRRWSPMLVDENGNSFARLRAWRNISYDDIVLNPHEACPSLFFPGCTLSSFAPSLAQAAFDYLAETGQVDGMTALCCGNPLWGLGLSERHDAYVGQLGERLAKLSTNRIIAGCPNCFRALKRSQDKGLIDKDIAIEALPQVLLDSGMRIPPSPAVAASAKTFGVFDSCSDRATGTFGKAVRGLLPPGSYRDMEHAGERAICCGSGGMVSFYDVETCKRRRARCVGEFEATHADCLVTSCISCANSIIRAGAGIAVHHYLELLFGITLDWSAHRTAGMEIAQHDAKRGAPAPSGLIFDRKPNAQ